MKRKSKFPHWLARSIASNLNSRYYFYLREEDRPIDWISWGKCANSSQKNFLTYLRRSVRDDIHKDPHWKYVSIEQKNLLNKTYTNSLKERRIETVVRDLNDFAKRPDKLDPISQSFLRAAHLEINKLNCFIRDYKNVPISIKAYMWAMTSRRNYLRMLRSEFPDLTRSKSEWDICFKQCRANLSHYQESIWINAFEKNRKKFERLQNAEN
ncbi:hypothetical protein [Leptospira sarikeiensis]|uniref:Uncharacterized protein n=1 Tax=Leptospira sarikeiensis TaxID=2484943 RepID=A0A4R9KFS4_9LEPT|nr:hypothetical protein [Leptospira sarikeiensis]TGL65944.1 hypothetical protein EHQ64_00015 [Leptospira sarikeiensis]